MKKISLIILFLASFISHAGVEEDWDTHYKPLYAKHFQEDLSYDAWMKKPKGALGYDGVPIAERLTVSMTSWQGRTHPTQLENLYLGPWLAIESIFRQTKTPHRVVLTLSQDEYTHGLDDVPEILKLQMSRGLEIHFDPGNRKALKKLLPALQDPGNGSIAVFDDDWIFKPNALQALWETHVEFPNAICTSWARRVKSDGQVIKPYREWPRIRELGLIPFQHILCMGGSGNLYPYDATGKTNHGLHPSVGDNIPDVFVTTDDLWWLLKRVEAGTPVAIAKSNWALEGNLPNDLRLSAPLYATNRAGHNDTVIEYMLEHFPLFKNKLFPKSAAELKKERQERVKRRFLKTPEGKKEKLNNLKKRLEALLADKKITANLSLFSIFGSISLEELSDEKRCEKEDLEKKITLLELELGLETEGTQKYKRDLERRLSREGIAAKARKIEALEKKAKTLESIQKLKEKIPLIPKNLSTKSSRIQALERKNLEKKIAILELELGMETEFTQKYKGSILEQKLEEANRLWGNIKEAPYMSQFNWEPVASKLYDPEDPALTQDIRNSVDDVFLFREIFDQHIVINGDKYDIEAFKKAIQSADFKFLNFKEAFADPRLWAKKPSKPKSISVVVATNRPQDIRNIIANFARQETSFGSNSFETELVLVPNGGVFDLDLLREQIAQYPEKIKNRIRVLEEEKDTKNFLAQCMNHGVKNAKYELITKMDGDDVYSRNHLMDLMRYAWSTGADIFGTQTSDAQGVIFSKISGLGAKISPNGIAVNAHVAGGSLTFLKSLIETTPFYGEGSSSDTRFQLQVFREGGLLFGSHHLTYIRTRDSDPKKHTAGSRKSQIKEEPEMHRFPNVHPITGDGTGVSLNGFMI